MVPSARDFADADRAAFPFGPVLGRLDDFGARLIRQRHFEEPSGRGRNLAQHPRLDAASRRPREPACRRRAGRAPARAAPRRAGSETRHRRSRRSSDSRRRASRCSGGRDWLSPRLRRCVLPRRSLNGCGTAAGVFAMDRLDQLPQPRRRDDLAGAKQRVGRAPLDIDRIDPGAAVEHCVQPARIGHLRRVRRDDMEDRRRHRTRSRPA